MEKKQEEAKKGAPEWMTTYGDLVTLLMCFFVLLFAFSEIDAQKFEAVMESFQGSAGILSGGKSLSNEKLVFDAMPESQVSEQPEDIQDLEILKQQVSEYLEQNDLTETIIVQESDEGLKIRFQENALFDSAKADIKDESVEALTKVGQILQQEEFTQYDIRVEGHTDSVPINTVEFPSNWELSSRRATNVVTFLIDILGFDNERLSVAAFEDNVPVGSNDTVEGRAKNRRVDIVILSESYRQAESNINEGENTSE